MKKRGFTIIEVLTVVVIIGVIVSIAWFGIGGIRSSARDDRRKVDLAKISSALERYKADCGVYPALNHFYPANDTDLRGDNLTPTCSSNNTYLAQVPKDPEPNKNYSYNLISGRYILCASFETPPSPAPTNLASCATCGATCNYTIVAP